VLRWQGLGSARRSPSWCPRLCGGATRALQHITRTPTRTPACRGAAANASPRCCVRFLASRLEIGLTNPVHPPIMPIKQRMSKRGLFGIMANTGSSRPARGDRYPKQPEGAALGESISDIPAVWHPLINPLKKGGYPRQSRNVPCGHNHAHAGNNPPLPHGLSQYRANTQGDGLANCSRLQIRWEMAISPWVRCTKGAS
jgi:hypothetical protein